MGVHLHCIVSRFRNLVLSDLGEDDDDDDEDDDDEEDEDVDNLLHERVGLIHRIPHHGVELPEIMYMFNWSPCIRVM